MGGSNQRVAWRIADLLDRELRAMQDASWRPSPAAKPKLDALIKRYGSAQERDDFEEYKRVCGEMLRVSRADFKAWVKRNGHASTAE